MAVSYRRDLVAEALEAISEEGDGIGGVEEVYFPNGW